MRLLSLSEASIQPRTSLSKFGGDSIHSFIRLLIPNAQHAKNKHSQRCLPDAKTNFLRWLSIASGQSGQVGTCERASQLVTVTVAARNALRPPKWHYEGSTTACQQLKHDE